MPALVQSKSTDASPIFIWTDAQGNSSAPAIVLLHGLGGDSNAFNEFIALPQLQSNFHIIRYDMRGFGRSSIPENPDAYTSEYFAADFAAVMDHFKVRNPILAGWSLGGAVAADIANHFMKEAKSPYALSGIISINAIPFVHADTRARLGHPALKAILGGFFGPKTFDEAFQAAKDFIDICFHDPESVPIQTRSTWVAGALAQPLYSRKLVVSRPQEGADGWKILAASKIPALVIYGETDRQMLGAENAKWTKADLLPDSDVEVLVVPNAGHAVFYDAPELVADKISEWAKKV